MKKILALLLVLCLLAAVFTGCGKEEPSLQETLQQTNDDGQQPAAAPESAPEAPE